MKKSNGELSVLVHLVNLEEVLKASLYLLVLQTRHSGESQVPTDGK